MSLQTSKGRYMHYRTKGISSYGQSTALDDLKPTSSPSTLLVAYYEGGQTRFGPDANYVNGPNRQITDECPATAYNMVFPNEIIGHRYILIVVAQADAKSVAHEFLA